jgi:hypothetical protein
MARYRNWRASPGKETRTNTEERRQRRITEEEREERGGGERQARDNFMKIPGLMLEDRRPDAVAYCADTAPRRRKVWIS